MKGLLITCLALVGAVPQRNEPSQARFNPDGHEFLELLPVDVTREDYNFLLDEFVAFLNRRDLEARGDFVDYETRECTPKLGKYTVEDPDQCDKYWECDKNGALTEKLCRDGFVYDIPGRSCNHPQRVECKARTILQDPIPSREGVTPFCPRLNGYFHFEDPERCGEYTDCVEGVGTPGKCSTGVVWSPSNLACTLPEQSGRPECVAFNRKNKDFICPVVRGAMRFGNHERYPDPKDCGKFYICLASGVSNPASCDKPLAYQDKGPNTGSCKPAEEVEGCEDYETE